MLEGWTCYLKTDIGRRVLRFSLALSTASLVAGIALLLQVQPSSAQRRPQPEILPSDSSQFKRDLNHFLTANGVDDQMSACLYYKAIGAVGNCGSKGELIGGINFNDWKAKNGLIDRAGEVSALYFNAVDLALVRSMHGKTSTPMSGDPTIAYYVCNYTPSPLNREGIQLALYRARGDPNNSQADACVAFDFSKNRPFTKFYLFQKGILVTKANLDGHIGQKETAGEKGNKFVPGLCKACHGASPPASNDPGDIGAHFLPFDLDNFDYLEGDSMFTRSGQESKFKQLNEMILDTKPPAAITDLINGWYKDGRIEQDSEFIPPDWTENEQLYRRVVKPSCRTCHVALDPDFASLANFTSKAPQIYDPRVCKNGPTLPYGVYRSMPNSKVTFDQFWLSPVQGAVLVRFLRDALKDPKITCPPPPP